MRAGLIGYSGEFAPSRVPPLPPARPRDRVKSRADLCVLLVEDDAADVYLIKCALAGNARVKEVVVAHDGVEALEIVDGRAIRPDLAIVDLHMPRKDGFALLRELSLRVTVEFPAVVLTSSRSATDAFRSEGRGAAAHLIKPNSVARLAVMLDEVIATI